MKLKSLFVIGIILQCNACSKDGDSENRQILGKWYYDRAIVYSGKDGKTLYDKEGNFCDKKEYLELLSDGKCTQWSSAGTGTDCDEFSSGATNYKYDAATKKLDLIHEKGTEDEFSDTRTVISLSSTQLVLENIVEKPDYNKDGIEDRFTSVYRKK